MSRLAKRPLPLPANVTATVDGKIVRVKGPKGELKFVVNDEVLVKMEGSEIAVEPRDQTKTARSKWGMSRTQIVNILQEDIKADLHLNDTQLGMMTGLAFVCGVLPMVVAHGAGGASQQALGTTPGEYKAEGSLTMLLDAWEEWVVQLGDGYMVRVFPITVTYGNDNTSLSTDTLHGVRIKKVEKQHQKGNEPLKVKLDLYIAQVDDNGVKPIPDALY